MSVKASEFEMESQPLIISSEWESSSPSETSSNNPKAMDHFPEDLYCKTLGKILHHVETPVTVGLYGACRHRLKKVMEKIQEHILIDAEQSEESSTCQCFIEFCHQIPLLLKIALCVPFSAEKTKNKTHYIFVPFKAWEFAGSDFLWAGLVTTLCGCIEKKYRAPLCFYKRFGIPVQEKVTCQVIIRYFKLILFFLLVISFIAVLSCSFIFHWDIYETMKIFLYPFVPLTTITLWELACGIYTFYQTSQKTINKLINNTKFSDQLGFMHSVKEEIEVLTKFLDVLDVYNKQQTKVVLQITHLDACPPEKVMGALEALSILLSDPEAPFISILAADSKIIAESVERSRRVGNMPGAGYQYLNQLITLPFSLPRMNKEDKKKLLNKLKPSEKIEKQSNQSKNPEKQPGKQNGDVENGTTNPDDAENNFILEFKAIIRNLEDKFIKFLPNKEAHMKQVIYTSWITLKLRELKFQEKWDPSHTEVCMEVIAWVLLANEWPFRVNWMLQYAEDIQQWREITRKEQHAPKSSDTPNLSTVGTPSSPKEGNYSLKEAFRKAAFELDSVKEEVKKLMELDRDPEIFFQLLQFLEHEHINLDVQKALDYWEITPNLHRSLKRYMELIRGSRTLKQAAWCYQLFPLSLLKMSKDDVCKELRKKTSDLGISETNMEQYIDKICEENLDGKALVYSLISDIKKTLGMSLGDWVSFSIHFLNVLPEDNTTLEAYLREHGLGGNVAYECWGTAN